WYRGDVAQRIVAYMQKTEVLDASRRRHRGLLSREDFAEWQPRLEPPVTIRYRGLDVYKCGPWTQGPVFLQQLRLLEGFELTKLGQNSRQYIHTGTEGAKLAFADRERYYADREHVQVPLRVLLSRPYADARRKLIDPRRASMQMRPGNADNPTGNGKGGWNPEDLNPLSPEEGRGAGVRGLPHTFRGDTTHTCAIHHRGNLMAATT